MTIQTWAVNMVYPGTNFPAETVLVDAVNPPKAKMIAERQYGGRATSCNTAR